MSWESYYSTLTQLPARFKKPVPFVVEASSTFKRDGFSSILDLGCGAGRHCVYMAKQGFSVVGIDTAFSALKMAKSWIRKQRLTGIELIRGSMADLPFRNCVYDAVVSVSVIHHAVKKDIVKAIGEVHRVLRKGGEFLANLTSVKDPRYGEGEKIELRTFRTWEAFEEKRFKEIHHYFTKREVSDLLALFADARIECLKDRPNYWKISAFK